MRKTINDFLWFVEERNSIQAKKDAGLPWPWSKNRILNETKFTCLDRNDDYGTESLFSFVDGMDLFSVIFYTVFFRSFYSLRTFFPQMTGDWFSDYEKVKNEGIKPGGRMPYQIYLKEGQTISSFLSTTAFDVIEKLYRVFPSFNSITIEDAAELIAGFYKDTHGKRQIFLGSEIAKDLSSLYPDHIDPDSICPFNTGARKGLNLLPRDNWMNKVQLLMSLTGMNPSKIEHSLCEWAKAVKRETYLAAGNSEFPKSWIYTPSSVKNEKPVGEKKENHPYGYLNDPKYRFTSMVVPKAV